MNWIDVAQDRNRWTDFESTVVNLRFLYSSGLQGVSVPPGLREDI
jgi:hypothetical protein